MAISRQELNEIDDDEFFAQMKDMSGRLSAINIHQVLRLSSAGTGAEGAGEGEEHKDGNEEDNDKSEEETDEEKEEEDPATDSLPPLPAGLLPPASRQPPPTPAWSQSEPVMSSSQLPLPSFPLPATVPTVLPPPPAGFVHQPGAYPMTPLPFPTLPRPSYPPHPLTQPPKLYEPAPGVIILHETRGNMVGGCPDGKVVLKTTKGSDLKHFSAKLSGVKFVSAKKKLFHFLETICSQDTIYTHIAILSRIAPLFDHRMDQLKLKTEYFTSFKMFFDEFQNMVFPDLDAIVIRELHQHKQGNRTVREYHNSFNHYCVKRTIRNLTS